MKTCKSFLLISGVLLAVVLLANDQAWAAGSGSTIVAELLKKLVQIIRQVVVVLAWGIGFLLIVLSVRDFVHSDEGYQIRRQAVNRLAGGLCCVTSAQIIDMVCAHLQLPKLW